MWCGEERERKGRQGEERDVRRRRKGCMEEGRGVYGGEERGVWRRGKRCVEERKGVYGVEERDRARDRARKKGREEKRCEEFAPFFCQISPGAGKYASAILFVRDGGMEEREGGGGEGG